MANNQYDGCDSTGSMIKFSDLFIVASPGLGVTSPGLGSVQPLSLSTTIPYVLIRSIHGAWILTNICKNHPDVGTNIPAPRSMWVHSIDMYWLFIARPQFLGSTILRDVDQCDVFCWYLIVSLLTIQQFNNIPYLVGGLKPSEKYESQLGWWFPIYEKKTHFPNHQLAIDSRNHTLW